mgnify:CR=1 FL=1
MNFKIIELPAEYPDVLIHRERDDDGCEFVKIRAFGTTEGSDPKTADDDVTETIKIDDVDVARSIIRDFSEQSAIDFCERNDLKY